VYCVYSSFRAVSSACFLFFANRGVKLVYNDTCLTSCKLFAGPSAKESPCETQERYRTVATFSDVIAYTVEGDSIVLYGWQTPRQQLDFTNATDSLGAEPTGARPPVPRVTCAPLPGPSPSKSAQRMVTGATSVISLNFPIAIHCTHTSFFLVSSMRCCC
jgi:hypothetical protein